MRFFERAIFTTHYYSFDSSALSFENIAIIAEGHPDFFLLLPSAPSSSANEGPQNQNKPAITQSYTHTDALDFQWKQCHCTGNNSQYRRRNTIKTNCTFSLHQKTHFRCFSIIFPSFFPPPPPPRPVHSRFSRKMRQSRKNTAQIHRKSSRNARTRAEPRDAYPTGTGSWPTGAGSVPGNHVFW